ncbi:MAG: hypothetical protein ACJASR_001622 [Psychroserpens sp.]
MNKRDYIFKVEIKKLTTKTDWHGLVLQAIVGVFHQQFPANIGVFHQQFPVTVGVFYQQFQFTVQTTQ